MDPELRQYSWIDKIINGVDTACRTMATGARVHDRARPDLHLETDGVSLTPQESQLAGRLLRVDHCGEICAQGLYQGQALTARDPKVAEKLSQSAKEENDHLAWCEARLEELKTRPSYLNPLWYAGSFMLGALAGLAGDRWSLGFVVETENQVMTHLDSHLKRLPEVDYKTRVILQQMQSDEGEHADKALKAGATELPNGVKKMMTGCAKIMTTLAFWI